MIKTKLVIPVAPILTPNPDMGIRWKDGLTNNAETINERRKIRIPDDAAFGQLIASQAADEYAPFVSGTFVSKSDRSADDIRNRQRTNLLNAFNKFSDNWDRVFEEVDGVAAKRYKDAVEAKQSAWEEGVARVLPFLGSRARGRQVAAIMGHWLTGNQHIVGQLPEGSTVTDGSPYDIAAARLRATLRAGLTQLLVQTGVLITASGYATTSMTEHNGRIKDFLERLSDPARATDWVATRTADKSYCVWFVEAGQLKLETQIYIP